MCYIIQKLHMDFFREGRRPVSLVRFPHLTFFFRRPSHFFIKGVALSHSRNFFMVDSYIKVKSLKKEVNFLAWWLTPTPWKEWAMCNTKLGVGKWVGPPRVRPACISPHWQRTGPVRPASYTDQINWSVPISGTPLVKLTSPIQM